MQPLVCCFNIAALTFIAIGCSSTDDEAQQKAAPAPNAPIAPPVPFAAAPKQDDRGSVPGGIPGVDRNDVEVVLPYGQVVDKQRSAEEQRRREFAARQTDREVAANARDGSSTKKLGDIDRQLGLETPEGEGNGPSFTLGVQKIKDLFKEKQFEEALIETNDLLKYYPRSAQLLLMKGTLHQRLSQIDLALLSYERAFEYEPSRKLQAQISSLKQLVRERENLRKPREGVVKPGGTVKIEAVPAQPKPAVK